MSALPKQEDRYTVEEYVAILKNSDERYEYFNGEIVAMAGGKIAHGTIGLNVRADNAVAIRMYEGLGFVRHCEFREALATGWKQGV